MDVITESWYIWMFLCFFGWGILQFIAKNRVSEIHPGMATKSDQFSMKTVFLSFRGGEASLFFTVLSMLIFFFLFSLGISNKISSIIVL